MRRTFLKNTDLSLSARFLLVLLMTFKGANQSCWPSSRTLAKICRVDPRSIYSWRKELEKFGYLKTERRGKNKSLRYWPSYIPKYREQQPETTTGVGGASTHKKSVEKDQSVGVASEAVRVGLPPILSTSLNLEPKEKNERENEGTPDKNEDDEGTTPDENEARRVEKYKKEIKAKLRSLNKAKILT